LFKAEHTYAPFLSSGLPVSSVAILRTIPHIPCTEHIYNFDIELTPFFPAHRTCQGNLLTMPCCLLVNWVTHTLVGMTVEGLRWVNAIRAENPELHVGLLLNRDAPVALAQLCDVHISPHTGMDGGEQVLAADFLH
jgi:hypothetical protein